MPASESDSDSDSVDLDLLYLKILDLIHKGEEALLALESPLADEILVYRPQNVPIHEQIHQIWNEILYEIHDLLRLDAVVLFLTFGFSVIISLLTLILMLTFLSFITSAVLILYYCSRHRSGHLLTTYSTD